MAAIVEVKDIPRENIFMVGIIGETTTRDLFIIQRPRKPFVINRTEALNLIGHLVTKADFTVDDIENSVREWKEQYNLFEIKGDDARVMLHPALNTRVFGPTQTPFERNALLAAAEMGLYLFSIEEAKVLCASLVRVMSLKPKEIDSGVIAIFDHARNPSGFGETEDDLRKPAPQIIRPAN